MALTKRSPKARKQPEPTEAEAEAEPYAVRAALAFGTDGEIYVREDEIPEELRAGRETFLGYALTKDERTKVMNAIHGMSYNLPVELFAPTRRAKRRR